MAARGVQFHVTGFGPFGSGEVVDNPTQARFVCAVLPWLLSSAAAQVLVEALPAAVAAGRFPLPVGASLASARVLKTSANAARAYAAALRATPPPPPSCAGVCVLHLGVHGASQRIRLERCAHNEATFRCADEDGWAPQQERVLARDALGARRETRLPVDALVAALAEQGFPVEASDDPGRFCCNYTFYLTLAALDDAAATATRRKEAEADANADATSSRAQDDAAHALAPERQAPPWHALFVHVPPADVLPLAVQSSCLAALMAAITAHLVLLQGGHTTEPT